METLIETNPWPVESIPDIDRLFMRLQKSFVIKGELTPGVFRDHGDGMSTDWCKYSTPKETQCRANKPEDNGVLELSVAGIRAITDLKVIHEPLINNRSHTGVVGKKSPEARLKLLRLAGEPIIPIPDY